MRMAPTRKGNGGHRVAEALIARGHSLSSPKETKWLSRSTFALYAGNQHSRRSPRPRTRGHKRARFRPHHVILGGSGPHQSACLIEQSAFWRAARSVSGLCPLHASLETPYDHNYDHDHRDLLLTMTPVGLRTPSTPRSNAPSPKPTFDAETLRTYMKVLLQRTLQSATWPPPHERHRVKGWMKEIGERVKERMLGAHYTASSVCVTVIERQLFNGKQRYNRADCKFLLLVLVSVGALFLGLAILTAYRAYSKYIVMTQINENLGQGGRYVWFLGVVGVSRVEVTTIHSHTVLTPHSLQGRHGLPLGRLRHSSARNVFKCEAFLATL